MRASRRAAVLLLVLSAVTAGCVDGTGPLRSGSEQVDAEGAERAEVTLRMSAGNLTVGGGGRALADVTWETNLRDAEPDINYTVRDTRGVLVVEQPESRGDWFLSPDYRYAWNVTLGADVPVELAVSVGAGRATVNVTDVPVTRLDVDAGAGDTRVAASGENLTSLRLRTGAGNAVADLTGEWTRNLEGIVDTGAGTTTLVLPRDVGVRVDVQQGAGSVDASGFTRDGDAFVNDAYGTADVTLRFRVSVGVGEVRLVDAEGAS